ncbi:DUF1850 domain-containing protein [Sporosarcina sp. ACRSM]|uniref:DUF1850 domain-containing protein n=1 Tax=Sporosarcina sp. ACRSM TaxID=2918216 RepID=UPI001EF55717|nr:DUF1850 domain-containing protein [Sporosarcina sp. ACRSM]MCG7334256.1 DUF1850 domain-containing protein [Sporosarcina sp. ACRSM]
MNRKKVFPLILLVSTLLLCAFFIPLKNAFIFIENRSENAETYYLSLKKETQFQIRYVHSIHLSDVLETYNVTADGQIQLQSMQYEDFAIGLPSYAEEGESLTVEDGVYTLTYDDNVIDSFNLLIGDVDADLAFRYSGKEFDLKKQLERGSSYTFRVSKLSYFQMLKGDNMDGK